MFLLSVDLIYSIFDKMEGKVNNELMEMLSCQCNLDMFCSLLCIKTLVVMFHFSKMSLLSSTVQSLHDHDHDHAVAGVGHCMLCLLCSWKHLT